MVITSERLYHLQQLYEGLTMSFWNQSNEDAFPESPRVPDLSRGACLNPKGLRAFLKLSRANTDDVIKQRLNSLLNDMKHTKADICNNFTDSILFQSWRDRLGAIEFCDKESVNLEKAIESNQEPELQEKYVDPRIDPYAAREFKELKESKYKQLKELQHWVHNEKLVEDIIQSRSVEILSDNCGMSDWTQQFKDWTNSLK